MTRYNEVVTNRSQDQGLRTRTAADQRLVVPAVDIVETPDTYVLRLDIPGASKETISVKLEGGALQVSASIADTAREGEAVLYSEMRGTGYEREFSLGNGIDRERVDAAYEDGVLAIALPKAEGARPKQIDVKVQ
jgi:HSP20 family protein